GDHGPNEGFVAGHVDYADGADPVELEGSKAEVDRDSATFLFGQSIRIDAREGLHERRLAVIDVAGGPEDHAALQVPASHDSNALRGRPSDRCSTTNSRRSRRCALASDSSSAEPSTSGLPHS